MHAPDHEHVNFLIEWWQQILSGTIIILTGWFLKSKGSKDKEPIANLTDQTIELRLDSCKKSILLSINTELNERDNKLFRYIEDQDTKLLRHIKDIIDK